MLRRSFIKGMFASFGAFAFFLSGKFKAVKAAMAGQVTQTKAQSMISASSVKQVIQMNDSNEVIKFVLANPSQADQAAIADKLRLLQLVINPCRLPGTISDQLKREQAGSIILRNEEKNPTNLAHLVNGIGKQWIQKSIPAWSNADLKRICTKAISN